MGENMKKKIILDLCGGTGSWSLPYKDAGYDVRVITLPANDVCCHLVHNGLLMFPKSLESIQIKNIYGILAAPPCTMFSFARTNAKKPRDLKEGMECVRACLDIIWKCMEVKQDTVKKTLPLQFWALENPYHGFLKKFLSTPAFTFDPWEFGDGYQKRTALWGHFNEPKKNPVPLIPEARDSTNRGKPISIWRNKTKFDYLKSKDIHPEAFGKFDRQSRRSITPAKFAQAFYQANL